MPTQAHVSRHLRKAVVCPTPDEALHDQHPEAVLSWTTDVLEFLTTAVGKWAFSKAFAAA